MAMTFDNDCYWFGLDRRVHIGPCVSTAVCRITPYYSTARWDVHLCFSLPVRVVYYYYHRRHHHYQSNKFCWL